MKMKMKVTTMFLMMMAICCHVKGDEVGEDMDILDLPPNMDMELITDEGTATCLQVVSVVASPTYLRQSDDCTSESCMYFMSMRQRIHFLLEQQLSPEAICEILRETTHDRCSACQAATKFISACVHYGNMSLEVIEAGARIACAAELGQRVEPSCDLIINRLNDIIQWIGKGLTPSDICKQLELCDEKPQQYVLPDPCVLCTHATTAIEAALQQDNSSVEIVRQSLETLCHHLSSESRCSEFLTHFDQVTKWLEAGEDPHEICQKLQLCSQELEELVPRDVCMGMATGLQMQLETRNKYLATETLCTTEECEKIKSKLVQGQTPEEICDHDGLIEPVNDMISCLMCQETAKIIKAVEPYGNETLPLVKEGLNQLCSYFPVENCNELLDKFDKLAALVFKGESESQACNEVGLCDAMTVVLTQVSNSPDLPCVLCASTGAAIQAVAQYDPSTVPLLKQGLGVLCGFLPGDSKCEDIVAKFDDLAKLIQDGTDPQTACIKVGLCAAIDHHALDQHAIDNDIPCQFCSSVANGIQVALQYDEASLPSLKQGLDRLCKLLPNHSECVHLIESFDGLVAALKDGKTPDEACKAQGLCPVTSVKAHGSIMAME